jgi:diketogulonate reductase-like aldo/keto reductase
MFAIPKASIAAHVAENAGAGALTLSDAEITVIDRAFPKGRSRALPVL